MRHFFDDATRGNLPPPTRKCCLTFLSERVYKYSKFLMWIKFFYISARMGQFASYYSRLAFMDTDSLFMSYQRERSSLEIAEVNDLLRSGRRIPFEDSLSAQRMAEHYLKTWGPILDYSSLDEVTTILYRRSA